MIYRVLRGGAFDYGDSRLLRSTFRDRYLPVYRFWYFGFRLIVRSP